MGGEGERESGWPERSAFDSVWAGEALYGALSVAGFTVIARHGVGHCYHGPWSTSSSCRIADAQLP